MRTSTPSMATLARMLHQRLQDFLSALLLRLDKLFEACEDLRYHRGLGAESLPQPWTAALVGRCGPG